MWKPIIIYFMNTINKIIYVLLSSFTNRSLTWIGSDCKLSLLLLIFAIFEHMYITTLSDQSNPPLKSVQIMVSKVLMFHENKELLPSVDWYDLYPGNNYPTEHITLVLVGIPFINQLGWVEIPKEDWARGTNTSSLFLRSVQKIWRH